MLGLIEQGGALVGAFPEAVLRAAVGDGVFGLGFVVLVFGYRARVFGLGLGC